MSESTRSRREVIDKCPDGELCHLAKVCGVCCLEMCSILSATHNYERWHMINQAAAQGAIGQAEVVLRANHFPVEATWRYWGRGRAR